MFLTLGAKYISGSSSGGREQMRVGSGQIGNPPLDDPGPGKHSINQPTSILSLAPPNSPLNIFRICPFLGLARTLVICTWGPLSSSYLSSQIRKAITCPSQPNSGSPLTTKESWAQPQGNIFPRLTRLQPLGNIVLPSNLLPHTHPPLTSWPHSATSFLG